MPPSGSQSHHRSCCTKNPTHTASVRRGASFNKWCNCTVTHCTCRVNLGSCFALQSARWRQGTYTSCQLPKEKKEQSAETQTISPEWVSYSLYLFISFRISKSWKTLIFRSRFESSRWTLQIDELNKTAQWEEKKKNHWQRCNETQDWWFVILFNGIAGQSFNLDSTA